MQQFFADPSRIQGNNIYIEGADVNHMKNVLRMKPGEDVRVNDGQGKMYLCCVSAYEEERAVLDILKELDSDTELPSRIVLFQGLPKGDKMEMIVQKAVELGAYSIVPFAAKRSVVRLDEKKAAKKTGSLAGNRQGCGRTVRKKYHPGSEKHSHICRGAGSLEGVGCTAHSLRTGRRNEGDGPYNRSYPAGAVRGNLHRSRRRIRGRGSGTCEKSGCVCGVTRETDTAYRDSGTDGTIRSHI